MNSKSKISVIAIFIAFFLLFNSPFITSPSGMVGGIPTIMIYIGVCWIILIALMRIVFFRKSE
ncbi:MAG: hypothetical protein HRT61_16200 [Ekhidna sp.]|nr:hypothetical protein [Ekhidna sp.]